MAKLYFKINTSDTAMNGDGIRDFENEFSADDIAKTLMSMYCEEDLNSLQNKDTHDTFIEANNIMKKFIARLRSGKMALKHPLADSDPRYARSVLKFLPNNPSHTKAIKEIIILLPGPKETSLDENRKKAVLRFYQLLGINLNSSNFETNFSSLVGALPNKLYNIQSYDEFKINAPDIYDELEKQYNRNANEFSARVNKLIRMRLPGVTIGSGQVFQAPSFEPASKSMSRNNSENFFKGNSGRGMTSILRLYLPEIHGRVINPSEVDDIISGLESDPATLVDKFADNVDFFSNYTRTIGVRNTDTPANIMGLIAAICRYGEQSKFGGLHNLAGKEIGKFIRKSGLELDADYETDEDFVQVCVSSGLFKNIYDSLSRDKRLDNPLLVSARVTKGRTTSQRITPKGKRGIGFLGLKVDVKGSGGLGVGFVNKAKVSFTSILNQFGGYSEGIEIDVDLPAGTYVYSPTAELKEEYEDSFKPPQQKMNRQSYEQLKQTVEKGFVQSEMPIPQSSDESEPETTTSRSSSTSKNAPTSQTKKQGPVNIKPFPKTKTFEHKDNKIMFPVIRKGSPKITVTISEKSPDYSSVRKSGKADSTDLRQKIYVELWRFGKGPGNEYGSDDYEKMFRVYDFTAKIMGGFERNVEIEEMFAVGPNVGIKGKLGNRAGNFIGPREGGVNLDQKPDDIDQIISNIINGGNFEYSDSGGTAIFKEVK